MEREREGDEGLLLGPGDGAEAPVEGDVGGAGPRVGVRVEAGVAGGPFKAPSPVHQSMGKGGRAPRFWQQALLSRSMKSLQQKFMYSFWMSARQFN